MGAQLHVYLVEDSPILRRLFTASLDGVGAQVVGWSADADTAIEQLSDLRPDVVIIDMSLHSGSGFDVLRALHAQEWANEVIKLVLTNHGTDEYREQSFELGADRFYDKTRETAQAIRFIAGLAEAQAHHIAQERRPTAVPARS